MKSRKLGDVYTPGRYDGIHDVASSRKTKYIDGSDGGKFLGYQVTARCACGAEYVIEQRLDPMIAPAFDATEDLEDFPGHWLIGGRRNILRRVARLRQSYRVVSVAGPRYRPLRSEPTADFAAFLGRIAERARHGSRDNLPVIVRGGADL